MLALTQKSGASIYIKGPGWVIEIRTLETKRGGVKLGINAPREFGISRDRPSSGGVPIAAPEPEPDPATVPALT